MGLEFGTDDFNVFLAINMRTKRWQFENKLTLDNRIKSSSRRCYEMDAELSMLARYNCILKSTLVNELNRMRIVLK